MYLYKATQTKKPLTLTDINIAFTENQTKSRYDIIHCLIAM